MTLLIRVRVKAEVWALARRDAHSAHSFLAMWTIFGIIALCCACGDYIGLSDYIGL